MKDFDSTGRGLDEGWAWRMFGGLSLAQAYDVFRDNPTSRQEDFMWMDYGAFEYYFPVLCQYLRSIDPQREDYTDDGNAKSLAGVIAGQISRRQKSGKIDPGFAGEIRGLCEFLLANSERFAAPGKWLRSFERAWRGVPEML